MTEQLNDDNNNQNTISNGVSPNAETSQQKDSSPKTGVLKAPTTEFPSKENEKEREFITERIEGENGVIIAKKRRTVTFAEMDVSNLDADGNTAPRLYTIIPPAKYDDCEEQDDYTDNVKKQHRIILLIKIGILIFFAFICVFLFALMLGTSQRK